MAEVVVRNGLGIGIELGGLVEVVGEGFLGDLVGTVADQVESVEGKGGPGAVADEPFQSGTVAGLGTDAGV